VIIIIIIIMMMMMYAGDLLVISPSAEGLQSLDVVHKHAQDWKLKVNTKTQT